MRNQPLVGIGVCSADSQAPLRRRIKQQKLPTAVGHNHAIRNAFDKVDYILKQRGTELVLTKNLDWH